MTHRISSSVSILIFVVFGAVPSSAQTGEAAQVAATAASPAPVPRILSKDPEYMKLLNPPQGNDFLQTYSTGYREKSAEIEAAIAGLSDENLRSEARGNEWASVSKKDQDRFKYEADVAFNDAKILFSQKHSGDLFEVGHVTYDENNKSLVVQASPTAPLEANFRVIMIPATVNQIYDKFHQIVAQEIDQKARDYVSKAGAGSICARNPDLCLKFEKEDIEKNLRAERIIVAARGDLASKKIDHLLLADYETEGILLELDPNISSLNNAAWRFSIGDIPALPADVAPAETQAQIGQIGESALSANTGESASNAPTPSSPPPTRVRIPDNVTAASIISQAKPQYPPKARESHIEGDVVLHAVIDKEGKISEVQVLSGDDLLAKSALEAVRQWRYKPIIINGEPADVETTITITFSLLE